MPSQEEYLDSLLKNMIGGDKGTPEGAPAGTAAGPAEEERSLPSGQGAVPAAEKTDESSFGDNLLAEVLAENEEELGLPPEAMSDGSGQGELPSGEDFAGRAGQGELPSGEDFAGHAGQGELPSGEDFAGHAEQGELPSGEGFAGHAEQGELPSDERFRDDVPSGEELLAQMMEEDPLPENVLPEDIAGGYGEKTDDTEDGAEAGFFEAGLRESDGPESVVSGNVPDDMIDAGEADAAEWDEAAAALIGGFEEDSGTDPGILGDSREGAEDSAKDNAASGHNGALDLDAVSAMSEDEIERLLASGAGESDEEEDRQKPGNREDDLLGMLEGTDDSDLADIQDMLEKSDKNEAVSEEIEALLNDAGPADIPETDKAPEEKATENREPGGKRRPLREKAAARREAKAAAKAEKAAAKAAAKAEKAARKENTAQKETTVQKADTPADALVDTDLLDAIVSGAELAGHEEAEALPGTGPDKDPDGMLGTALSEEAQAPPDMALREDLEGLQDMAPEEAGGGDLENGFDMAADTVTEENVPGDADAAPDDMGFDMNSLFGDVDDSGLGSGGGGDPVFPDFVDIDSDHVDNLIPELEEKERKKKGLLSRLFEMLTEEDEEEENENIQLSSENRDILNDLDNEKQAGKKKKKKVKKADLPEDEDGKGGKGKAKKAKKEKKPKPEKPKKEPPPEPLIPERRLSPKKVFLVMLVCASLGVLIIVFANASVEYKDKKIARDAYYAEDYKTCYQNLFGKDLNETEQIMFGTSKSILYIRLWLREYEMFAEAGEEVEALDSLIQTVNGYPALYEYALQWNAGDEVAEGYAVILNILSGKYGLTEDQAKEIAAVRSDYKYTEMVVAVVQGRPFGSWDAASPVQPEPDQPPSAMEDELPEEDELTDSSFIDGLSP